MQVFCLRHHFCVFRSLLWSKWHKWEMCPSSLMKCMNDKHVMNITKRHGLVIIYWSVVRSLVIFAKLLMGFIIHELASMCVKWRCDISHYIPDGPATWSLLFQVQAKENNSNEMVFNVWLKLIQDKMWFDGLIGWR